MTLTDPTDEQLNLAFAEKVAGWKHRLATHESPIERDGMRLPNSFGRPIEGWWHDSDKDHLGVYSTPPPFVTSADAVLPWLMKCQLWKTACYHDGVWVEVETPCFADEWAATFPKAAVLALLAANGVKIIFTTA